MTTLFVLKKHTYILYLRLC